MLVGCGAATVAFALALAAPAGATVIGTAHGFKYVQNTLSISGGGAPWSDSVSCGSGWIAQSGGTVTTGFFGDESETTNMVGPFKVTWTSAGYNVGFGKNLSTVALCRVNSAPVAFVSNRVTVGAGSQAHPAILTADAACPGNEQVAAGGVKVEGSVADAHVSGSFPVAAAQSWRATVVNEGAARHFTVRAQCLPALAAITDTSTGSASLPADPNGAAMDLSCPSASAVPISGGAKWSGNLANVHIGAAGPIDAGGGVSTIPDKVWRVGAANLAGASKTITGYVICKPA
jgi:hypothetical protein